MIYNTEKNLYILKLILILSIFLQLNAKDVSYFDSAFTEEAPLLTPVPKEFLDEMNQEQFKGFSYTDRDYALPAL